MKSLLTAIVLLIIVGIGYFLISHHSVPGGANAGGNEVTFYCPENAELKASFGDRTMMLTFPDARTVTLPQTVSGSGTRYEATTTEGIDVVFWSEGDNAFVMENNKTTYTNCTAALVADSDAPGYRTYTDLSKTFTFAFPTSFGVSGSAPGYTTDWSINATTSGRVLARIDIPQSYMPGTNFGDARFTVGTSAGPGAVKTCTDNSPQATSAPTTVTLGGVKFSKVTSSDAGAGNRYDTTSYRVVRNDQCYAIEYTIHYANIQNYPAGSVKEFDEKQVQGALEEIVQSFSFLQ